MTAASFATSLLTAAFGLGGGVALLAILGALVPPAALIPVHGLVQLASNAGRAGLMRARIRRAALGPFLGVAALGAALGGSVAVELPAGWLEMAVGAFVIWAALVLILGAETWAASLENLADPEASFLARLAAVNLFIAVFNLLPAFPMDGGRVLRAALSAVTDRVQATRIAAYAGQALAFGLGLLGLVGGNPVLLLIAFFVFIAAGAESNDVAMRDLARRMQARDAMITTFDSLSPEDTVGAAGKALIRTTQGEFPVLDAEGRLLGVLTRNAIFQESAEGHATRRVTEVMQTDIPSVSLATGLETVFDAMHRQNAPAVAVVREGGYLIGYVTRENLGELMVLNGRRGR
jgi:stage IV sporulation protein FB